MQEANIRARTLFDNSETENITPDDQSKNNFTNALKYCMTLLKAENLVTDTPPEEISATSIAIGEEIFKEIMLMLEERKIILDDNLITVEESDDEEEYEEVRFFHSLISLFINDKLIELP